MSLRVMIGVLILANLISAIGVVHARYRHRQLFVDLSRLEKNRDELNIEFSRLQLEQATWAAFNDYEFQLVRQRTGKSIDELLHTVQALIVTHGAKGSTIYAEGKTLSIPVAKPERLADPTGCGDAYRAGLLYGLMNDLDWETTGRIAALMGAIKIEQHGTQNHHFEKADFEARFKASFGYAL